ncbi:hypothetical protein [Pseudomonas aeruginosa]|uniref:phage pre-tape measure protein n=1 Tax=Pseudomonas aeruginosa TaxID=287 RepID=UPI000445630D|nr:hypothetical protein [Pseudomonas aeruginosa]KAJ09103.1 hypothetical protein M003_18135 [Pseudomonas aeruginosa IGB83]
MALSDYTPERREVCVNGKPLFYVEGLSLETLALLIRTHMPDFEAVFAILINSEQAGGNFNGQLQRAALGIAQQAPGLAANIIAACSGEELSADLVRSASRLPFTAQVEALTQIGELTFREAGGIKKAMESLITLLMSLRAGLPDETRTQASFISTKGSAAT